MNAETVCFFIILLQLLGFDKRAGRESTTTPHRRLESMVVPSLSRTYRRWTRCNHPDRSMKKAWPYS